MLTTWALVVLFVFGWALRIFSALVEFAVANLDRSRLQEQADDDEDVRAKRLLTLLDQQERWLGTALYGAVLAAVLVISSASMLLYQSAPEQRWGWIVLPLGLLLAIGGEALPRAWAQGHSEQVLDTLALPLRILAWLFRPFTILVTWSDRMFARILPSPVGNRAFVTRQELRTLLKEAAGEEINPMEREMLTRVLDFSESTVDEVMLPLIEVHAIEDDAPLKEALEMLISEGHSRLPVYRERIDNVIGVLMAFDVLYADDLDEPVRSLMRPCKYVPESQSIDRVLAELQKSRMGMAIAVNEYGGAVGLITLEDILEQVVGDIEDEFDRRTSQMRRQGPNDYVVSARLKVDKLAELLKVTLPEGDYETVGGMLLAELGHIPRAGEAMTYGPIKLTVRRATDRAVQEVQVTVLSDVAPR